MEEGQMFDIGDLVRLTKYAHSALDAYGGYGFLLHIGDIVTVSDYHEDSFAGPIYGFKEDTHNSGEVNWRFIHENFELYKRHDIEFCLGDRVERPKHGKGTVLEISYKPHCPVFVKFDDGWDNWYWAEQLTLTRSSPDRPEWLNTEQGIIRPDELTTEQIQAALNPKPRSEREARTGRRDTEL